MDKNVLDIDIDLSAINVYLIGSSLGYIFGAVSLRNRESFEPQPFKLNKLYKFQNIIFVLAINIGVVKLIQNGFALNSLDYFTQVRGAYNENKSSYDIWWTLGSHLFSINSAILVMISWKDEFKKCLNRSVLTIICFAPLFFSNGTRTFLIYPFIYVIVSALLAGRISRKNYKSIAVYLTLSFFIFALIGKVRGGYDDYSLLTTILIWPVSSIIMLPNWIDVLADVKSTGALTFEYFSKIPPLSLILQSQLSDLAILFDHLKESGNSVLVVPMTIVGRLVGDFGLRSLFFSSFIYSMALAVVYKMARHIKYGHIIRTLIIIGVVTTIQTTIFTASTIAVLIYGILIFRQVKNV